jgi:hypothetical protein
MDGAENVRMLGFVKEALGKAKDPDAFVKQFLIPGSSLKVQQLKNILTEGAGTKVEKEGAEAAFNVLRKAWFNNTINQDDGIKQLNKWITNDLDGVKLFLGDGGSLLLGFIISFILVYSANQKLAHPILLAWSVVVFVYEFLSVNIHRLKNKQNIFRASQDHLHHLLLKKNKSVIFTNILIMIINLLMFIIGYFTFMPTDIKFTITKSNQVEVRSKFC